MMAVCNSPIGQEYKMSFKNAKQIPAVGIIAVVNGVRYHFSIKGKQKINELTKWSENIKETYLFEYDRDNRNKSKCICRISCTSETGWGWITTDTIDGTLTILNKVREVDVHSHTIIDELLNKIKEV
jgi:hypothetical protein